jgi:hypothetical protein
VSLGGGSVLKCVFCGCAYHVHHVELLSSNAEPCYVPCHQHPSDLSF